MLQGKVEKCEQDVLPWYRQVGVVSSSSETQGGKTVLPVVVQDLATQWIQSYPCKFSGDGKEFSNVSRAIGKAKGHIH